MNNNANNELRKENASLRAINAEMLATLKQIYAADVASLAEIKASGVWDFLCSPENERLVELTRVTIAKAEGSGI